MSHRLADLAAPGVAGLKPYQPGKPIAELEREYGVHDIVKLASNENPLGPGPAVREAMIRALDEVTLYPDANGFDLKHALAARHGVSTDCITLGNGSNDVLVLLAEAFLQPDLEAVYSQYAFAVYPIAVQAVGARHCVAPANAPDHAMPLGHDLDAMATLITDRTRLVFIANPNNPTGTWLSAEALESFIRQVPEHALVVVDEAYFEYVEDPAYPHAATWLEKYPNLVVTRTFSKAYGLAGLRIGYALSHPDVAGILNRVRQPFNVNNVAQAAAVAALEDTDYIRRSVQMNNTELERVADVCRGMGLIPLPSVCNFLLVDMGRPAAPLFDALLREAVIVRPVANYGLPDHLRISIGTPEMNDRLIAALEVVTAPSAAQA